VETLSVVETLSAWKLDQLWRLDQLRENFISCVEAYQLCGGFRWVVEAFSVEVKRFYQLP
jgi:hypothetical protein